MLSSFTTRHASKRLSRAIVVSRWSHHRTTTEGSDLSRLLGVTKGTASGRRLLSTTTTTTTTTSSATTAAATAEAAPVRDFFLDNLGKIFLSAIAMVIATLVRSSYGTSNMTKVREELEEASALDPLEIEELRKANQELTPDLFRVIEQELLTTTNNNMMTYSEFVTAVRTILKGEKGAGCTIGLGYLLDRVVIAALQHYKIDHKSSEEVEAQDQSTTTSGMETSFGDSPFTTAQEELSMPLPFWLTVLSLALQGPVPDRIRVLYEIMQLPTDNNNKDTASSSDNNNQLEDDNQSNERNNNNSDDSTSTTTKSQVTVDKVVTMVGYLQETCQLVPDKMIVPILESKYPTQQYRKGTPEELVAWESAASEANVPAKEQVVDIDLFADILRSKSVCAWGECYFKKKFVP